MMRRRSVTISNDSVDAWWEVLQSAAKLHRKLFANLARARRKTIMTLKQSSSVESNKDVEPQTEIVLGEFVSIFMIFDTHASQICERNRLRVHEEQLRNFPSVTNYAPLYTRLLLSQVHNSTSSATHSGVSSCRLLDNGRWINDRQAGTLSDHPNTFSSNPSPVKWGRSLFQLNFQLTLSWRRLEIDGTMDKKRGSFLLFTCSRYFGP